MNAEEAKKLIAVDGYAIVDVRDKTQFDRAHIKSCYHVPLFIENKDNDLGKSCFLRFICSLYLIFFIFFMWYRKVSCKNRLSGL